MRLKAPRLSANSAPPHGGTQLGAVVARDASGNDAAVAVTALGHPHIAAGACDHVTAGVGRHTFGGAQADGIGRQVPADADKGVADVTGVAQPQRRSKATAGRYRQGQFMRCRPRGADAAPTLADALNGATHFWQGGGVDLHGCLLLRLLFTHSEPPLCLAVKRMCTMMEKATAISVNLPASGVASIGCPAGLR